MSQVIIHKGNDKLTINAGAVIVGRPPGPGLHKGPFSYDFPDSSRRFPELFYRLSEPHFLSGRSRQMGQM